MSEFLANKFGPYCHLKIDVRSNGLWPADPARSQTPRDIAEASVQSVPRTSCLNFDLPSGEGEVLSRAWVRKIISCDFGNKTIRWLFALLVSLAQRFGFRHVNW